MEQTMSFPVVDQFNFLFEYSNLGISNTHSISFCWEFNWTVVKSY